MSSLLPTIVEENCDHCITWLGCSLFIFKPPYTIKRNSFSLDADGLFAIYTPWILLYFPQWFYRWLYRNEQ